MFLNKETYIKLTEDSSLIEGFTASCAGAISYDLRIDYVFENTPDHKQLEQYSLKPGETVIIASKENLNLPNNVAAHIIERNSSIRKGLSIASSVYIPGHHTKVFTRVTNNSNDIILLKKDSSIVSVMFYQYDSDISEPYTGAYQGDFDFKSAGFFHTVPTPDIININKEIDDKLKDVKDIEKKIYDHIMIIMTVFIAAFSIVNLNINFLEKGKTLLDMLVYNLTFLGGIGVLVTFISLILQHVSTYTKLLLAAISLLLLFAAMLGAKCV